MYRWQNDSMWQSVHIIVPPHSTFVLFRFLLSLIHCYLPCLGSYSHLHLQSLYHLLLFATICGLTYGINTWAKTRGISKTGNTPLLQYLLHITTSSLTLSGLSTFQGSSSRNVSRDESIRVYKLLSIHFWECGQIERWSVLPLSACYARCILVGQGEQWLSQRRYSQRDTPSLSYNVKEEIKSRGLRWRTRPIALDTRELWIA